MSKITIKETEKYEPLHFQIQKMVAKKVAVLEMLDSLKEILNLSQADKFELKMDLKEILYRGKE